jgi:hypothetical protein
VSEDRKDEHTEPLADSDVDADLDIFSEALDDFFEAVGESVPASERTRSDSPQSLSLTREQGEALFASASASGPGWDQLDPKYAKILDALKRASRRPNAFHLRATLEANGLRGVDVLHTLLSRLADPAPISGEQQDSIVRSSIGQIVDPIQAEAVSVYLLDSEDAAHLSHLFFSRSLFKTRPGLRKSLEANLRAIGKAVIPKGSGLVGMSIQSKSSLSTRSNVPLNVLGAFPVHSVLTVPIVDRFGGEEQWSVFGALQVINKTAEEESAFSGADLDLMDTIGGLLGRLVHLIRDQSLTRSAAELAGYRYRLEVVPKPDSKVRDAKPANREFALAQQLGMDVADFDTEDIDPDVIARVPKQFAETYCVCPIDVEDGVLVVAMADPRNPTVLDDLRFMLNIRVRGAISNPPAIRRAIKRYYGGTKLSEIEALAARKLAELEAASKRKLEQLHAARLLVVQERARLAEDHLMAPAYLIMSAVDGELPAERSAALEDQLTGADALAREEWAWMQRVSLALESLELGDPPPETWSQLADFVSGLPEAGAS